MSEKRTWEVDPTYITSEVCAKCTKQGSPHCCEMQITDNIPPRVLEVLKRGIEGSPDLRITDTGAVMLTCTHLNKEQGTCNIYEDRPQLCDDYNCITWTKTNSFVVNPEDSPIYIKIRDMFRKENERKKNMG